ncbi:unnamed protein product, partial [Closterium sp. NIES-54]
WFASDRLSIATSSATRAPPPPPLPPPPLPPPLLPPPPLPSPPLPPPPCPDKPSHSSSPKPNPAASRASASRSGSSSPRLGCAPPTRTTQHRIAFLYTHLGCGRKRCSGSSFMGSMKNLSPSE